jgi:beta-aspartyl-dipeptidase (metallo-type)
VNRNPRLLAEAVEFVHLGGYADLTTLADPESQGHGGIAVADALQLFQEKKVSLSRITVSSDSNGSLPVFDKDGNLSGLTIATQRTLLKTFIYLVKTGILPIEACVKLFSTNPADFYKLGTKGKIEEGRDADLILFNESMELTDVLAKGRPMMKGGKTVTQSTFNPLSPNQGGKNGI